MAQLKCMIHFIVCLSERSTTCSSINMRVKCSLSNLFSVYPLYGSKHCATSLQSFRITPFLFWISRSAKISFYVIQHSFLCGFQNYIHLRVIRVRYFPNFFANIALMASRKPTRNLGYGRSYQSEALSTSQ